jgi:hypothetical protein
MALMARVEDNEDWDSLRRAVKTEAERRGLLPTHQTPPEAAENPPQPMRALRAS